jgi:hypothetical protein
VWRLGFPNGDPLGCPEGLSNIGQVSNYDGVNVHHGTIKAGKSALGSFAQSVVAVDLQRGAVACRIRHQDGRSVSA